MMAHDHTFQVRKNCPNADKMEAVAVWDVVTETGEIAACAVLVVGQINSSKRLCSRVVPQLVGPLVGRGAPVTQSHSQANNNGTEAKEC